MSKGNIFASVLRRAVFRKLNLTGWLPFALFVSEHTPAANQIRSSSAAVLHGPRLAITARVDRTGQRAWRKRAVRARPLRPRSWGQGPIDRLSTDAHRGFQREEELMPPITMVIADQERARRRTCVGLLHAEEGVTVVGEADHGLSRPCQHGQAPAAHPPPGRELGAGAWRRHRGDPSAARTCCPR